MERVAVTKKQRLESKQHIADRMKYAAEKVSADFDQCTATLKAQLDTANTEAVKMIVEVKSNLRAFSEEKFEKMKESSAKSKEKLRGLSKQQEKLEKLKNLIQSMNSCQDTANYFHQEERELKREVSRSQ